LLLDKPRIPIRDVLLFGLLPSRLKVLLYRLKGYRIGKGVSIGFGSVVCGSHVEIGDHTSIGFFTIIRGTEIQLGPYVQIGSTTFLDTPRIAIGEGSRVNEQVFVGGLQFPDSKFVVGRNSLVQQLAFINPSPSVIVGDDAVIGGHSLIFGHSSWQSQLEGYSVEFGPIEIGNSASLAWRVFVLPNTRIGDGAVVGANSVVQGDIPPRTLAIGFPARVVKRAPDFPTQVSDADKVRIFGEVVRHMISFFEGSGLNCKRQDACYEISSPVRGRRRRNKRPWVLEVLDGEVSAAALRRPVDVVLSLREIPEDIRRAFDDRATMWIDVAGKRQSRHSNDLGAEVVQFLKRYGVRTLRSAWDSPAPPLKRAVAVRASSV
jgi:acetyltransferase-like isoleucine patch superfamily enzyme